MRRSDVLETLRRRRESWRTYGVRRLGLFGSFAYDRARGDSDIDLLVEFERETGYFGLVRLRTRLEDLLGRRVDIVTPAALKGPIRQRILEAVIYVE